MKLFKKYRRLTYIIVEDLSFKIINEESSSEIEIPRKVIENSLILDKSHLYYILKKYFENNDGLDNFVLLFVTDKILNIKLKLPKISLEDLDSMISYEVEEALPINLDEYIIKYKYSKLDDTINCDIRLFPKDIFNDYLYIFEKLNKDLLGIYHILDALNVKNKTFVYFGLSNIIVDNNNVNRSIFYNDFTKLLEEYELNYSQFKDILNLKYTYIEEIKKERIINKSKMLIYKKINYISKLCNKENILFIGSASLDYSKDLFENLNENNKIDFELSNNDMLLDNNFNFLKSRKKEKSNYIIPLILALIIISNSLYFTYLKNVLNNNYNLTRKLELNLNKLDESFNTNEFRTLKNKNRELIKIRNENKNLEINKKNNLIFHKLFLKFENSANENILFTEYYFEDNLGYISGISKSKKKIDEVMESISYNSELIEEDIYDGVINFKIKIELEDER